MNFEVLQEYGPRMLAGLLVTLELVVISITLGALLAVPLALGRMSRNKLISRLAFAYVYAVRGTPLLAQTFLVYYGAGQFRPELQAVGLWWLFKDAFFCCVLTFTLNTAAYQAEIYRGAILAVPRGQSEAAMSLGLTPRSIFRMVVAPQAMLLALRPLGNEIILMIKGSSVAAIVTVFDLMGVTRLAYSRTFDFQVYLWAAVLYLVLVEIIRRVWDRIELRLTRHIRHA
ncbi:ABC transporter permease [Kaistia geumhonensis]|uniref:Polar amino acid transport system permease protein n=1 Tax=Kaistia geumhonensis TaxID=410839 RepID=A0ABU0M1Q6_9HYPH|nr:ABC transporter permease [Kaistia geumhonensis]MCX5479891.1 ABC transporter permease [Kaistia geumhonensis]MDQ0514882.1 polar amino acid transport system permease protein [Kaistia geumhonensis]